MSASPNAPAKLYKFVGLSGMTILRTQTLRFTRPSDLNDPFEVRPYLETLGREADWSKEFEKQFEGTVENELAKLTPQERAANGPDRLRTMVAQQQTSVMGFMGAAIGVMSAPINAEIYRQSD